MVCARRAAMRDGRRPALSYGRRHRPRDRGRPSGLRISDPMDAVFPDRRICSTGCSALKSVRATSNLLSIFPMFGRRPTAPIQMKSFGVPRLPRVPWITCVIRLTSYECGMDQPTFTPVQQIVGVLERVLLVSGAGSTKPAGSVKIRVETIAHYLERNCRRSLLASWRRCQKDAPY